MTVVTQLPDGRIVAKASISAVTVPIGGGNQPITVTVTDLRRVEEVLQFNLNLDPGVNATPYGVSTDKNVVGATIYCSAGTTLSGEVVVVGH